jgi:rod shape-determining protein MreC
MDHQPPPFFKRGPAPLAQLSFYAALSLALIFVDSRFQTLELLRQGASMFTHPMQQVAHAPVELIQNAGTYVSGIARYQEENARLKRAQLDGVETMLRTRQLEAENERLRTLLELKGRLKANGRVTQILYAARDPFSRRVIVDKGQQDKIVAGQPVVDGIGVVGQVTRVFPFVSEITLITDKDQAIPVQIVRNGLRSVVFGLGNGQLELRFMPANADVQNGDLLVTSGLDGIFLPGFPVAKVVHIERDTSYSFARIYCEPVAGVENFGDVMVLDPRETIALPAQITSEAASVGAKASINKAGAKKKRLKRD